MSQSGLTYETMVYIPPALLHGDGLPPIEFTIQGKSRKYALFGRFNEEKDTMEYALSGSPGSSFKISISDGNSPYGWKIKKHGMTRGEFSGAGGSAYGEESNDASNENQQDSYAMKLFQKVETKTLTLKKRKTKTVKRTDCGYPPVKLSEESESQVTVEEDNENMGDEEMMETGSSDGEGEEGEGLQAGTYDSIFEQEDIVAVPHASMRASRQRGVIDAKDECVMPWSFYGPSLPEILFTNKIKIKFYKGPSNDKEQENVPTSDSTMDTEKNQNLIMSLLDYKGLAQEVDEKSSKSSNDEPFEEGSQDVEMVEDTLYDADQKDKARFDQNSTPDSSAFSAVSGKFKVQELVDNLKNLSSAEEDVNENDKSPKSRYPRHFHKFKNANYNIEV